MKKPEKNRRKTLICSALVLIVIVVAVVLFYSGRERHGLPDDAYIPRFSLKDHRARIHSSSELWGKVVVILFWMSSAEASVAELKGLDMLESEHKKEGLEVIAISLDKGEGKYLSSFIEKHKVKIPLLIGSVETAQHFGGIAGVPTTFIFDREGRVREELEGFRGRAIIEEKILGLL